MKATPLFFRILFATAFIAACSGEPDSAGPKGTVDSTGVDLLPDTLMDSELLVETGNNPERENWQKPQLVISRLGDLHDKVVADIGAGTGYFTFRLAEKATRVIAADIDERYLEFIDKRIQTDRDLPAGDIETRLIPPDDPGLKEEEVDLVLIVNTYIYIENRTEYFGKVLRGIRPEGQLVIIDFRKKDTPIGPPVETRLSAAEVWSELELAGFHVSESDTNSLPYQYILFAGRGEEVH